MPGAPMIRLKRGQAPGLTPARPLRDGTPRWRWLPGPSVRARGFKGLYLLGAPGAPIDAAGWAGLGFAAPPAGCAGLTLDGPPLDLSAAIAPAKALSAAAAAQAAPAAPAPRPAPRAMTLNDWLDRFMEAARAGKVRTRDRNGKPVPIRAKTIEGYAAALQPLRRVLGDDRPADIRREDLRIIYETLIDDGKHAMAVAAQRALSRAFNWLAEAHASEAHALPRSSVYSGMGLGQPAGRLRMALPGEAEAMFDALKDPAAFAAAHGLAIAPGLLPAPAPAAAAAWRMMLWTAQRGVDVMSFNDHAFAGERLHWIQSKGGAQISIPLTDGAREALRLARAARAGLALTPGRIDATGGLLFWDAATDPARPYRQVKASGSVYYKRFNQAWGQARALAALAVPSLQGGHKDPFGNIMPALNFADGRDTAVTRLFEAMEFSESALAPIASWHGSSVENLLKLLKHYLVLNPVFANRAGDRLEAYAVKIGLRI